MLGQHTRNSSFELHARTQCLNDFFLSFKAVSLRCIFTILTGNGAFAQNIFGVSLSELSLGPGTHCSEPASIVANHHHGGVVLILSGF